MRWFLAVSITLLLAGCGGETESARVSDDGEPDRSPQALKENEEVGTDLSNAHTVRFWLYFAASSDTTAVTDVLEKDGFDVGVERRADEGG